MAARTLQEVSVHPSQLPLDEFVKQLRFEVARASGPGGQHRNKVETAVRATHLPTGLRSHASERRSMSANKDRSVKRIRLKVAMEHREPLAEGQFIPPGLYQPSELWRSRLQGSKLVCSSQHADYPALLAELFDVLEHHGRDLSRTAGVLGSSTSQLIKFLAREPEALSRVNGQRRKAGLKPFR